jgi:hypothetical protein
VASAATDANGAAGTAKAAAASGAAVAMSGPDTSSAADEGAGSGPMIGTLLIKCPDSKGVVASVAQVWKPASVAPV